MKTIVIRWKDLAATLIGVIIVLSVVSSIFVATMRVFIIIFFFHGTDFALNTNSTHIGVSQTSL